MKKTLVALAALAATSAFAQSTVQITGNVDAGFQAVTTAYGDNGKNTQKAVTSGQQNTNNVTFRLTEDLGAGMKANALFELDFASTAANNIAPNSSTATQNATVSGAETAEAFVGLSGNFGEIKLGNANLPTFVSQTTRSPFGSKLGGGYGDNAQLGTKVLRSNGSMQFATPVIAGFQGAVAYKPGNDATAQSATAAQIDLSGSVTDYSVTYVNGPLKLVASNYTKTDNIKQTQYAANYVLGNATLIAGTHTEKNHGTGTAADKAGKNVAIKYALTPTVTLLAQHATLDDKTTADKNKTINAVGAQYALSKRTNAYARYIAETNDNNGTGATDKSSVKTTMVGLAHSF